MRTTIKANKYPLSPESEAILEEKLAAPLRLLGEEGDGALLEIEIEEAPAEGRSAEPVRVVANVIIGGKVFHSEAVKPSPLSAADRVRSQLEAEIRKFRGRERSYLRRGRARIKKFFGR